MKNQAKKKPIRETEKTSEKKWGKAVMGIGFNIFPSLILRAQQRLGLNATQLNILLQLTDFWWEPERLPWPSLKTIGKRTGLSVRQVQRYLKELEGGGLIKRIERFYPHQGHMSNEYDLSGLVKKLEEIAPDFKKAEDEAKEVRERPTRRKNPALKRVK